MNIEKPSIADSLSYQLLDILLVIVGVILVFTLFSFPLSAETGNKPLEIIDMNTRAVDLKGKLDSTEILVFKTRTAIYTAEKNGRLKVQSTVQEPVVYEIIIVTGRHVSRNSMNKIAGIDGIEKEQWQCLGKLFGGFFTLKNFSDLWEYKGVRIYGSESFHVLSTKVGTLTIDFFIDKTDNLLKQMILRSDDSSGQVWEQAWEFGDYTEQEGFLLPGVMYQSRVGLPGTGAPRAQRITSVSVNPLLEEGFFSDISVNIGTRTAKPGYLEGQVIAAHFSDEDMFCVILSNWDLDDIEKAGFKNGDRITFSCGSIEFHAAMYRIESEVSDPTVYLPPNALFTSSPTRLPMFYVQFNELSPRERYEKFKGQVKQMSTLKARILE